MNAASTNLSAKLGVLLICLFALPFAGFGLFALSQAFRLIGAPAGGPPFWYPMLFGIVFSGIGFGMMFLALTGSKRYARQQQLQAEHATEPWLWRADWAAGRVNSKTRTSAVSLWVFTILWNLISLPIAWLVVPAAVKKGPIGYVALIFPVVGVLMLINALYESLELGKFGNTCFEMTSVPGVVGRELKGTIQARFAHSPDHGIRLQLTSVHRYVTGSGNSQSTQESILWRDEAELNSAQICPSPTGTAIPVAFHLPVDAHPTEQIGPRDEYLWLLEARADVPGVDYHDVFEVPVFRTAQTPTQAEEAAEESAFAVHAPEAQRPAQLTVRVQQTAEGTEFYFPAARNKSFGVSTTVFAGIFGTVAYFLTHTKAPFIFPVAFGFFALLIGYISLQMWLGTTRVVIGNSLTLQSGYLGGGKAQQIALPDISAITDKITAQQGGGTGTPYYDIEMTLRDGKKLTLGHALRDKHETEWLVSEMRRLAGLDKKSMTAGMA